jgi:RHS repeat-associated protein
MIGTAQRFQISTLCASYRYHFNGQEKTDEWTGNSGDSYDFGARMYDSRLGRWMTLDPLFDIYASVLSCEPAI